MAAYYLLICRLVTHWLEEMASIGRKLIPISEISSGKNCEVHARMKYYRWIDLQRIEPGFPVVINLVHLHGLRAINRNDSRTRLAHRIQEFPLFAFLSIQVIYGKFIFIEFKKKKFYSLLNVSVLLLIILIFIKSFAFQFSRIENNDYHYVEQQARLSFDFFVSRCDTLKKSSYIVNESSNDRHFNL